jgi:hypothetical protein
MEVRLLLYCNGNAIVLAMRISTWTSNGQDERIEHYESNGFENHFGEDHSWLGLNYGIFKSCSLIVIPNF